MAEGGMAPRPMIPTAVICVNLVCTVTPTDIPPSAAYIGFLQVFTEKPFWGFMLCVFSGPTTIAPTFAVLCLYKGTTTNDLGCRRKNGGKTVLSPSPNHWWWTPNWSRFAPIIGLKHLIVKEMSKLAISYYNLSLTDVRTASSRLFMARPGPNLVRRSGAGAEIIIL